jgi:Fe-S-cluster-containing dehydrogenase component/formate-dependent nitrite reductase membrane component NrfD
VRYGFILDQTRCIGCHACTVACKAENDVPLGGFRTWVKHIERGTFPDARRSFAVLRCNHCDDAPCIEICPTRALFRRDNGIVDFDAARCIGCKSCMQACPYDALYLNPVTNTAEKCHYCAHRVEQELQPACVVVCPTQAIVAGDLDDPESEIARRLAREPAAVRKPEKGTRPKTYYVGADQAALDPMRLDYADAAMVSDATHAARFENPRAEARVTYDVDHPAPWGFKIAAYLFTKAVAAGAAMAPVLLGAEGLDVAAPVTALAFLALTMLLLVVDLKRPDRFLYILLKPNFSSWLVLGSYILMAFGGALCAWLAAAWLGWEAALGPARLASAALGAASACYSGFLFNQCDGRELWQGPGLFVHLFLGALAAGAAWMAIFEPARALPLLGAASAASALLMWVEHRMHRAPAARAAAREFVRSRTFWVVVAGLAAPVAAAAAQPWFEHPWVAWTAAGAALIGLFEYERLWIRAGQAVPIS